MAEILKEWLTERLQKPITWEAKQFGNMMKNGYVVASVLHSYHVINEEKYFMIRQGNAQEDIKSNWKFLSQWLREIEVALTDNELENIMDGKSSVLLRLFYKMFLHLDKKDRTNFIQRERKMVSTLVEKMGHRFTVDKIPEEEESFVDDLSKPLLNEKHYIEWQRKKAEQIKETFDNIRHRHSKNIKRMENANRNRQFQASLPKKLTSKEQIDMEKFAQRYPCKFESYTYEDLLALEEKALEHKSSLSDTEWAKNYMDNLYTRIDKNNDSEEFQKQLRNTLSGSLWDRSVAEEEIKSDTDLAKKVMKLSQFEKQMCTQIMETKQQARNLVRNRIQAEKEFAEQRDQQFGEFLDNVKEQIHLEFEELDFEKQRQKMLHKKLYAEKMKRKRAHYYDICYETMLSIVDYATKFAYFKRLLEGDIPEHFIHEWKTLYYKNQPIFDILEPIEDILYEYGMEGEAAPEEDEIITLELERQEVLNNSEFIEYHNYSYPWTLDFLIPNYDPESEDRKYEYLGTRILGHVVYTLLEIKYPFPPLQPPADLPKYISKAMLRGLPDASITVPMQVLLDSRQIHVARLESAVNFCLRRYKSEMVGCTDIDLAYDKFTATAKTDEEKDLLKLMKTEDETTYKGSEMAVHAMLGTIPANAKQTQTPKSLPEEEMVLSKAADLGRYAYEALNFGESLTDHLIAAMLVEYLKAQEDINGFVIINYPNSYREAQILEQTFSGISPPDENEFVDRDDIYLEESIAKHRKKETDLYKDVRLSRVVGNPHKQVRHKPFESYFTSYICLKETDDILQQFVIWDLDEENSEIIDRFYAALGVNYSMYYEVMDKDFLAQICIYIIGELLPVHSLDSLFGINVLKELEFSSTSDKRIKSKIIKPDAPDGRPREKSHSNSTKVSKTSVSEIYNNMEVKDHISEIYRGEVLADEHGHEETIIPHEENKILAGEEDWDYGEMPISEPIGVALASYWEEVERVYIHDLQQLFLAIRMQMNCLVPYTRYIRDKMDQIITLPSAKQDIVCNFQKEYNEFQCDWRDINLAKNEWHCRVKELQIRLYDICDKRKLFAQQQRQALICDNWAMEELTTIVNSFISCMQAELNRSILTYQMLHDFYFTMLKGMPPTDRLSSKDLMKITKESEEGSGSRKSGEDKLYRQLKAAFQDLQLKDIEIDFSNNPFNMVIENNMKYAVKVIKETNDSYRSLIAKEYTEVAKIQPPPKKLDDISSEDSIPAEEIFKVNALKCIEEWTMGVNGEMFRAHLRMLALQFKCYTDMKLFNDHIYNTFMRIQNDINTYYLLEIESVDRLCKYLQMAIENGRRVPETLVLENNTFVIDPNLLQFPPDEPPGDSGEARDIVGAMDFKISQLAALRSQFKIVAPTGLALQQAFIYLLQDFMFFGKESCDGNLFPEVWLRVDPEQIPKFVFQMYGDTVYVDWRDFLIYCINIRFPSVEELLGIRKKFRCNDLQSTELISRDMFLKEELWFESDFDPEDKHLQLRKTLIKHFLFELFETETDMMNYSAFLLAFCKNVNPIEGFTAALSMAVGKMTCFCLKECQDVINKQIKQKKLRDARRACALSCTELFLNALLDKVINYCEGTSILELLYVPPVEEKKGKKGKSSGKTSSKKSEGSSGNYPKLAKKKSSPTKIMSEVTINTTFICHPCEDERVEVEKPLEKEEIEEEQMSEPKQDENIAYSVSQSVITNVLRICLPWYFELFPKEASLNKTPYAEQVAEVLKLLEGDTDNGDIYVSKFVDDEKICKILHKVKRFTALDMLEELRKIIAS